MNLLYILERPIQNDLPYKLMAKEPGINTRVIYFALNDGVLKGNENINQSTFSDKTLYSINYELVNTIRGILKSIRWSDTVIVYGHFHYLFRWAIFFSWIFNKKLVLTSDATGTQGLAGSNGIRLKLKPFVFKVLYNYIADALFVPSTASLHYFKSIGIKLNRITLTPYTVNEAFINAKYLAADNAILQKKFGIDEHSFVAIFCGKLIERKRPQDLIYAFSQATALNSYLIIVGDGPMRDELQLLTQELQIQSKVIFTGFVDYTDLPAYYKLASVLVVPAEHEPYGLPVNEAMLCGLPVIASDAVGAGQDLIEEGITGFTYPVADISALATKMELFIVSPELKASLSANCKLKMQNWSSESNVDTQVTFFKDKGWLS